MSVALGTTETYHAFVLDRSGGAPLVALPFTEVTWERITDQPSQATCVLAGLTGSQYDRMCELVAELDNWAFELGIYRNRERVWAGPITGIDNDDTGTTITASDVSAWLGERFIHDTHEWKDYDVGAVFSEIVSDAMKEDNKPGIQVFWKPNGIVTTRTVKSSSYRVAIAEIGDLTTAGMHWSTFDRTIFLGDYDDRAVTSGAFGDKHFVGRPKVHVTGPVGTRWTVRGTPDDVSSIVRGAVGKVYAYANEDRYGIHEKAAIDSKVKTDKDAVQAANVNLGLMDKPSVLFSGGTLHPSAPWQINDLIPGLIFDVSLSQTCKPVNGRFRLTRVAATHNPTASTIDIECEPLGQVETQQDITGT